MRRLFLALVLVAAPTGFAAAQEPLRVGVDGTFAPHAFPRLEGGVQGFNIDLVNEIGRRLGRPVTIDAVAFSGLIPALNAGRYDFLGAPTSPTPERLANLLFTEGYLYSDYQFAIRRGSQPITSLDELRGKAIAVNKGSNYDAWAQANAERYGFTVQTFDSQPDAVQAVFTGRAYANLAGNTVIRYAATRIRQLQPDYVIPGTRIEWAFPLRKDNVALRNQIEGALECMKQDGTVARISEKWFGTAPSPDSLERTVSPGYGLPDRPGHDPAPHELRCP
ncbi:transporter substrate-binding domain-containing protein [Roseomonas sp. OT10]|uniref:transporter substrate-binding domain-containing protein n=1 Tax=Roseomonas cutis TaxID=2897332 RepID=UPI001E44A594|nr:transporter substrate-binding domain-containing protein [Roseomonas sp. OT10]UFN48495.1 transporter substrate-binding domain-containing protein [Roseomonas sp. OT10]